MINTRLGHGRRNDCGRTAEEEQDLRRLLLGLGEAAEGDLLRLVLAELEGHVKGLVGLDEAGRDHVDSDLEWRKRSVSWARLSSARKTYAVVDPFSSEALAEVRNGRLGRIVEALHFLERVSGVLWRRFARPPRRQKAHLSQGRVDDQGGHGADDDDRPLVLALDPERRGGLARVEHPQNIDVEEGVEVIRRELEGGLDDRDSGVLFITRLGCRREVAERGSALIHFHMPRPQRTSRPPSTHPFPSSRSPQKTRGKK